MSPKAFSPQEKDLVREKLIDAAEKCLATTGIRKTSVDELARAAGIFKGAFYLIFESRELLFWVIINFIRILASFGSCKDIS